MPVHIFSVTGHMLSQQHDDTTRYIPCLHSARPVIGVSEQLASVTKCWRCFYQDILLRISHFHLPYLQLSMLQQAVVHRCSGLCMHPQPGINLNLCVVSAAVCSSTSRCWPISLPAIDLCVRIRVTCQRLTHLPVQYSAGNLGRFCESCITKSV